MGLVWVSWVRPQTIIPYRRNEENNELYKEIRFKKALLNLTLCKDLQGHLKIFSFFIELRRHGNPAVTQRRPR